MVAISYLWSRNITLFQNEHATGAALLVHNRSSPSISDCLHHILKIKPNLVRQVLDGSLIELTTMEKLLLERQKGGRDRLIEVAAQ